MISEENQEAVSGRARQYPPPSSQSAIEAEFDKFAESYYEQHKSNIAITGELPEYFSEYKVSGLADVAEKYNVFTQNIVDFGCGVGNSVPHFRKYFPSSNLSCLDVSSRSIEIAKNRYGEGEKYNLIKDGNIPLEDASQDMAFSACVFHHIPHAEHQHWLCELNRIVRPGGMLIIYEHNPLNPLTLHAVNTCPLDENAELIRGGELRRRVMQAGWGYASIDYCLFFPSFLRLLRPLEKKLGWLALGAQYRLSAVRTA
jgi:ubiquinone/menaquinone biosynthesis C-methylase UbiE